MESLEIDPHIYGQLIFKKKCKGNSVEEEIVFSINGTGTIEKFMCKKKTLQSTYHAM